MPDESKVLRLHEQMGGDGEGGGLVRASRGLKRWGPFFNGFKCLIYMQTNSWDSPSDGTILWNQSPNKSPPSASASEDCHQVQMSADVAQPRASESVKSGMCYFCGTHGPFDQRRDKSKAKSNHKRQV